jgi:cell wall-associated NlpC family hydrolase
VAISAVRRGRRSLLVSALCAAATATAVLFGATGVRAEPSIGELEKQIDQAWNQLEPLIEKHNGTRLELAAKKKQVAALAERIRPLELQVDLALNRVGDFAAVSYKGGSPTVINTLLQAGTRDRFTARLESLDQFARQQRRDIQSVLDAKQAYEAKKQPLDALVSQLTRTEADLAARKKQIDGDIKRLDSLRLAAYGRNGTAGGSLRPAACPASYPGGAAGKAVRFACLQIGKPYVWGAAGPGSYDCSGLTGASWAAAGVSLPHNAAAQRRSMKTVGRGELRPGDLVFFYGDLHHVGITVGNGWMVHAPTFGQPVTMAKIDSQPVHSFGRPG